MFYDPKWEKPVIEPWRKALFDAADLIEKDGWVKVACESNGAHCAMGAIAEVANGHAYSFHGPVVAEAEKRLLTEINRHHSFFRHYSKVTLWNDLAWSKRKIIRTMRRAARRSPK